MIVVIQSFNLCVFVFTEAETVLEYQEFATDGQS